MNLKQHLQHHINTKTKPLGALGMLEDVALQIGLIQNTVAPKIIQPHIVVFAADHGIAATGKVNPYPQSVTAQMVLNFVQGGAAINVFCRQNSIGLTVVDAGVNAHLDAALPIVHASVKKGTANYCEAPAMTPAEAETAIANGKAIVAGIAAKGCNCIGFGEMGIGNTSSASLIMSALLQLPVAECVGRGTGSSDVQLQQKIAVLQQVYQFHQLHLLALSPMQVLCKVGGLEIATMVGAYLQAAQEKMVIVVDGFIATAALLIASAIQPAIMDCCVFAHCSGEQGHQKMLHYLQVKPLLQLGLRLGEGTGAALAIPLVQQAVAFLNEMASFESAGVDDSSQP
jgi:nicotinate-nucleotide--dimethylbenzimidazole phosphoribosyltransferase